MAPLEDVLSGSYPYKTKVIGQVARQFDHVPWGIGDKVSDAQAYADHRLEPIIIFQIDPDQSLEQLTALSAKLQALPATAHAVDSWDQVAQVIFGGQTYRPERLIQRVETLIEYRRAQTDPTAGEDGS
jgi:hypothetical protein